MEPNSRRVNKMSTEGMLEPQDKNYPVDEVTEAYERGKSDAAAGQAPAEEWDAAYMNGYNEHKTSGRELQRAWRDFQSENWYDGSAESVTTRLDKVEAWKRAIARLIRNTDDPATLRIAGKIMQSTTREIESLASASIALSDSKLDEYLDSLPALTVAKSYDKKEESSDTWMKEESEEVEKMASADWEVFTTIHASEWTEDRDEDLLSSEMMFREAAIDYVESKTAMILDVRKRASIIDGFVTTAERTRRQIVSPQKKRKSARKTASTDSTRDLRGTLKGFGVPREEFRLTANKSVDYGIDDSFGI